MERITDQQVAELERRIESGMTTAADVDLLRAFVDQVVSDVRSGDMN